MAASQGVVRFHQHNHTVTFRVEGRAAMNQSLPIKRQTERCVQGGASHVRVDLSGCTHMDSTFLGTLLALKKNLEREGKGELTLLAPSVSCSRILYQMGLSDVLAVQETCDVPEASWTLLPCDVDDPSSFKRNIVQAHEELAALPGPAGEQFQAVIRCMSQAEQNKPRPPADPSSTEPTK